MGYKELIKYSITNNKCLHTILKENKCVNRYIDNAYNHLVTEFKKQEQEVKKSQILCNIRRFVTNPRTAFAWRITKEGYIYWKNIYFKLSKYEKKQRCKSIN